MSDDLLKPDDVFAEGATQKTAGKKSQSQLVRIVTWSVISLMIAAAGVDFWARASYNATVDKLKTLDLDATEFGIPLAEVEQSFSGWYNRSRSESGEYVYHWVGLRKYIVRLMGANSQAGRIDAFETGEHYAAGGTGISEEPTLPDNIPEMPVNGPMAGPTAGGGSAPLPGLQPPPSLTIDTKDAKEKGRRPGGRKAGKSN